MVIGRNEKVGRDHAWLPGEMKKRLGEMANGQDRNWAKWERG
jgi:hypothetical protein